MKMSSRYYISLLVYSLVKISCVIVWFYMVDEGAIGSPFALQDFLKPAYAVLTILLLLLLPRIPSNRRKAKITMITLIVGLLITNLYLVVHSFFSFSSIDHQSDGLDITTVSFIVFCVAIVTLIYESIKTVNLSMK